MKIYLYVCCLFFLVLGATGYLLPWMFSANDTTLFVGSAAATMFILVLVAKIIKAIWLQPEIQSLTTKLKEKLK